MVQDATGVAGAIDIHTHVVPEKFPAYTGVGNANRFLGLAPHA